jgi:hypothetical protein
VDDGSFLRHIRVHSGCCTSVNRFAILLLGSWLLLAFGCRTVVSVRQVQPSSAPDISRVTLLNGSITTFDDDLGWYNVQAGTIEGMTADSQHVEYHLSEILKVETVRAYSIIPAVAVAIAPLAVVIYLLYKLLSFL